MSQKKRREIKNGKDISEEEAFGYDFEKIFKLGNFWFEHNCGIPICVFDQKLKRKLRATTIGKATNGLLFVNSFEHRKYPFVGWNPHLEKNQFVHFEPADLLIRDPETLRFTRDAILNLVNKVQKYAKNFDDIPKKVRRWFDVNQKHMIGGDDKRVELDFVFRRYSYSETWGDKYVFPQKRKGKTPEGKDSLTKNKQPQSPSILSQLYNRVSEAIARRYQIPNKEIRRKAKTNSGNNYQKIVHENEACGPLNDFLNVHGGTDVFPETTFLHEDEDDI